MQRSVFLANYGERLLGIAAPGVRDERSRDGEAFEFMIKRHVEFTHARRPQHLKTLVDSVKIEIGKSFWTFLDFDFRRLRNRAQTQAQACGSVRT